MGEQCRGKSWVDDSKDEEGGKGLDKNWLSLSLPTHHDDDVLVQSDGGSPAGTDTTKPSSEVVPMEEENQSSRSSFFVPLPLAPMDSRLPELSNMLPEQPPPPAVDINSATGHVVCNQGRQNRRSNPRQRPREGKDLTIKPPYPWATNTRAGIHTIKYLTSKNVDKITGEVHCKNCQETVTLEYDLKAKFFEISTFIFVNTNSMFLRAPPEWSDPKYPNCTKCGSESSIVPVISQKKRSINWLFLFVMNTIGHCGIKQLKYFCKHNKAHRTGAKDRVLYSTYMSICKQLSPSEPRFAHL